MNADQFEIYRLEDKRVLPELHGLGACLSRRPRLGGPRADGLDCYEIGYLHSGSIEWLTDDGIEEATGGSIVIDLPGDIQGGVDAIVLPSARYWIRLDPGMIRQLPGVSDAARARLDGLLAGLACRHFRTSRSTRLMFERILMHQRRPGTFAEELSRAALHEILFNILAAELTRVDPPIASVVSDALAYMNEVLTEDVSVDAVARRMNLSPGYFHELFHKETGTTPARYMLKKRLALARTRLIRTEDSITALALDLGFSTSQYFATAFKRFVGITPREYREVRRGVIEAGGFQTYQRVPEVDLSSLA